MNLFPFEVPALEETTLQSMLVSFAKVCFGEQN